MPMSRKVSPKTIHYVRAVFGADGAPMLAASLRKAFAQLKTVSSTEIVHPTLGTMAVRERNPSNPHFVELAIGVGVANEAMGTLGLGVNAPQDSNQPQSPAAGRAFKLADAFCLVDDNEVLLCTDGQMRVATVNWYLRSLVALANPTAPNQPLPAAASFELRPRIDRNKQDVLAVQGVKEMHVHSAAYAASAALDHPSEGRGAWLHRAWGGMLENLRDAMTEAVPEGAQRDALVKHFGDVNVSAVFKVSGGVRGEPIAVKSLAEVAVAAEQDAPDGTDVTLVTEKGTVVQADSLILKGRASIKRLKRQNDLDYADAWQKLENYRNELAQASLWKT